MTSPQRKPESSSPDRNPRKLQRCRTDLIESLEARQLLSVSLPSSHIAPLRTSPKSAVPIVAAKAKQPAAISLGATASSIRSIPSVTSDLNDQDIGAPALAGSASYDAPSDTTTLTASGADIYGTSDQFNFASRAVVGDAAVLAYVNSITNTDPWAKAGVMFRVDSAAHSAFAGVFVSPSSGIVFEWRTTAGAAAQQVICAPAGGPTHAPVSLKLTRSGNNFAAFYSTDQVIWLPIGQAQSVVMPASVLGGIALTSHNNASLATAAFSSVGIGAVASLAPAAGLYSSGDQLFLDDLEHREFQYFYDEANANTGLIPDLANAAGGGASAAASIAAQGFGLTALTIGDQRGWITHDEAYQRALKSINFLRFAAPNFNGFYYHFMNAATGQRDGTSEVSSVDTAELMSGVLSVAQYWAGTPLAATAQSIFDRVNWPWFQQSSGVFYGAWTPESGFSGGYGDFSEASLLYLLGVGSAAHPTSGTSWYSWSRTPVVHYAGYNFVTASDAALFTVQYPQNWFDLRGLYDRTGLNFYQNAVDATLAQRQFQISLSGQFSDYGPNAWGLTPASGQNGYVVVGGPPAFGPIDGIIVPTGPGGSLAFTPRQSIDALQFIKNTYSPAVFKKYGLVDSLNPLHNYTSPLVLGIDLGATLLAAENARSNFVWNTFNQTAVAKQAIAESFNTSARSAFLPTTGGNWNTASNWSNNTVPNSAIADAEFYGQTGASQTVSIATPITVGKIGFNNSNSFAINGAGPLTIQSAVNVVGGTQSINVPTTIGGNVTFNVVAGATLTIANPFTIAAGASLKQTGGGTVVFQSSVTVLGGGSIDLPRTTQLTALVLQSAARASIAPGGNSLLKVGMLSLATTARLELNDNDLIVTNTPRSTIEGYVRTAFNFGGQDGPGGIFSAAAASNPSANTTLGLLSGREFSDDNGGTFDGQTVNATDVLVKYTYFGDVDFNGAVDSSDYNLIDFGYLTGASGWANGDVDYNGAIDSSDYNLIDFAFVTQGSPL